MHYFLLIYFSKKPLHVSSRLAGSSLYTEQLVYVMRYVDWLLAWLYRLQFIQSWSSCWWAASLLETCSWFILYYTDQNSVLSPAIHIISNSLFTKQQGIRRKYQVMQQNNCPSASIKHIYVTSTRTYPMCYQWQKLLIEEKNQVWQKGRGNEEEETVWWP